MTIQERAALITCLSSCRLAFVILGNLGMDATQRITAAAQGIEWVDVALASLAEPIEAPEPTTQQVQA